MGPEELAEAIFGPEWQKCLSGRGIKTLHERYEEGAFSPRVSDEVLELIDTVDDEEALSYPKVIRAQFYMLASVQALEEAGEAGLENMVAGSFHEIFALPVAASATVEDRSLYRDDGDN